MGERIDHAAEARQIVHEYTPDEKGQLPFDLMADRELAEYQASMVEAQVHATLALVEQQRIANLIAVCKPDDPRDYDAWPEIEKGLGL